MAQQIIGHKTMSQKLKYVGGILLLSLLYLITAKIGLSFYAVSGFATLVWPPTGIALAALLLYGFKYWPGVAIGAFLANIYVGGTIPVALGISLGNTLEAVTAIYLLRRYVKLNYSFESLRDSIGFIVVVVCVPVISASVGVITLAVAGIVLSSAAIPTWTTWWLGNVLGALTITPFLICWLSKPYPWKTLDAKAIGEGILLFASLVIIDVLVFLSPWTHIGSFSTIYLVVIPFMWAAIRTGPHGITLSVFITTAIASLAAILNYGTFSQLEALARLFSTEIFLAFITVIFLPFTSVVAEEKKVSASLGNHIKQLREALQKISSEDNAKNEFLAILAHELRNPLSPVVTSLELMTAEIEKINRPDMLQIVKTAETHIHSMVYLLDDLLDISRISRKRFKLEKETVELRSIINHSQETVNAFYISRNHQLSVTMPKKLIWISADPVRIEQILNNLLYNAAKYTPMGGNIWLSVVHNEKNDTVSIRVRDNGIGIAPDVIKKIFKPFAQRSFTRDSRVNTGLGIGLAFSKRLVELHNGTIRAVSAGLGKGSEFIVTLPTVQSIQLQIEPPIKDRRRVRRSPYFTFIPSKLKEQQYPILVVDDNKDAADGLKTLLERTGYKTAVAYSGKETLETVRKINPKIIILDIGLPDMSGYEVAEILRKEYGDSIAIIALTGYGQDRDRLEAKKSGFNYHMTKPIRIDDLKSILMDNKG